VYEGLAMGTANSSPAIACRINNGAPLRQLLEESKLFLGVIVEDTWRSTLNGTTYQEGIGHGRDLLGQDGEPSALIWAMIDNYLIHAPTKKKCCAAFLEFMDYMVQLGFICQKVKTSPPKQVQKFSGMLFDTTGVPAIKIPEEKVSIGKCRI
jgi:hypothetical protein